MSKTEVNLMHGDCLELLRGMDDNSIDSIVTDPPYGLSRCKPEQVREALENWIHGRDHNPGGKGFMGKSWDAFVPGPEVWRECLRVLKPGGHMAVFAGSRTVDLMGVSVRLAGFEIRDQLQWLYGSGFPKSLNVSKAIDKAAGAEREVVGKYKSQLPGGNVLAQDQWSKKHRGTSGERGSVTAPATPAAQQWDGWGTALKPAHEPIILARKPLAGTVAANVLEHGTGGINVDGCRVGSDGGTKAINHKKKEDGRLERWDEGSRGARNEIQTLNSGRWPANVILDEEAGALLDEQSGGASRFFFNPHETDEQWLDRNQTLSTVNNANLNLCPRARAVVFALSDAATLGRRVVTVSSECLALFTSATPAELRSACGAVIAAMPSIECAYSPGSPLESISLSSGPVSVVATQKPTGTMMITVSHWKSDGSAAPVTFNIMPGSTAHGAAGSRFKYCPKASKREREAGLDDFDPTRRTDGRSKDINNPRLRTSERRNGHPCVKPLALMSWLCRLITPPGGTVLDPFTGSGSTGCAAAQEGFNFVGCELSEEYVKIAKARIEHWRKDDDTE